MRCCRPLNHLDISDLDLKKDIKPAGHMVVTQTRYFCISTLKVPGP